MDPLSILEAHTIALKADGRSAHTIRWYRGAVLRFSEFLEGRGVDALEKVRVEHVRAFTLWLMEQSSPNPLTGQLRPIGDRTVRGYVAALKGFFSFAQRDGYLDKNPLQAYRLPKAEQRVIVPFSDAQLQAMLSCLNLRDPLQLRDACIMLFLLDTGVRVSELVGLELDDMDLVGGSAKVFGKGKKERVVYFESTTRRLLWRYVHAARKPGEYLFESRYGSSLTRSAVLAMIADLAKRAGITGVRASPHTFRHTFAVRYLLAGGDQSSLQILLGHSSPEMVTKYVHLTRMQVQDQHSRYSPVESLGLGKVVERLNKRKKGDA